MDIYDFTELESNEITKQILSVVNEPYHYSMICAEPDNEEFKRNFIKEMYLLLASNSIYLLVSTLGSWDRIRNIQGILFPHFLRDILKVHEADSLNTMLYIKRLDEYYAVLTSSTNLVGMDRVPEILLNSRKHFETCLNDYCKYDAYTDSRSPIVATVLFNTCRFIAEQLDKDPVTFEN